MLALLDPSKMENAVKVITQLDEKTTGISLKVSLSQKDCLPFRFILANPSFIPAYQCWYT